MTLEEIEQIAKLYGETIYRSGWYPVGTQKIMVKNYKLLLMEKYHKGVEKENGRKGEASGQG